MRYRYTLRYDGPIEDLLRFLSNDEKEEIEKNSNFVYFGETCFGHKILGLSQNKSEELKRSVQNIRRLTQKYSDDKEVKKALCAQRSLIKALRVIQEEIPTEIKLMDDQNIPLMKNQLKAVSSIHQEYLKKQREKRQQDMASSGRPDHSWSALQNYARRFDQFDESEKIQQDSIVPISMIAKDTEFQTKMRSTFDHLPFGSAISAVDISFKIERNCSKKYGYFFSGRPKLYTELLLFLLNLEDKGQIQLISGDTNDIIFKKIGDNKR